MELKKLFEKWSKKDFWTVYEALSLWAGVIPEENKIISPKEEIFASTEFSFFQSLGKKHKNNYPQLLKYIQQGINKGVLYTFDSIATEKSAQNVFNKKVDPKEFLEFCFGKGFMPHEAFEDKFKEIIKFDPNKENKLQTKEKNTLLKLIIAMAINGYGYDHKAKRSPQTSAITEDLERLGLSLDKDTVRKWLKESAKLIPETD